MTNTSFNLANGIFLPFSPEATGVGIPGQLAVWSTDNAIGPTDVISLTKAVSGTYPFGEPLLNGLTVTSDIAAAALGLNYFGVNASFGGSGLTGTRSAALFNLTQTAPNPNNTVLRNGARYYVGVTSNVFMSGAGDGGTDTTSSGSLGGYYGANFTTRSSATNVRYNIGCEVNNFGTTAATQAYNIGFNSLGLFANQGAVFDAAHAAAMGAVDVFGAASPGPGWKIAYAVAELGNGFNPIDPTNGVAFGGFVQTLSTIPCKYVLDMRAFTATTSQIVGTGFSISPTGRGTFGDGTGQHVFKINGGNGSGQGGLIQIGVAGTYLTAVGTVGAFFGGTSGVSFVAGFSGLSFYTNNVLAVSIDTSQNATFAGAVKTKASATGAAGVNIPSGTAPTSPVDGDMWYDGTNVKFRVGGTTKTFTLT